MMGDGYEHLLVARSYNAKIRRKSSSETLKLRLQAAKAALFEAQRQLDTCRWNLKRLQEMQSSLKGVDWAEFRLRLRVGKAWMIALRNENAEALEVRELLSAYCDAPGRDVIFTIAPTQDRAGLAQAAVLGSLLCERASANARTQKFFEDLIAGMPVRKAHS